MREEVTSNSVIARFGNQRPRIEDALVEIPPVEDWIVVSRFVKRRTEAIDNRVDYLLGHPHRGSGGSEHASPHNVVPIVIGGV